MNPSSVLPVFLAFALTGSSSLLAAQAKVSAESVVYRITKEEVGAKIDGSLDEAVWQRALVVELAYETDPGENVEPPVRTECRAFYTTSHLYFGCHAFDDPEEIRARLRDRDMTSFSDDVVGLSVDPFNAQESSVVFDVNPLGVQNDRRYTEQRGRSDPSWDATWDSAGQIVSDGYIVEAEIPFAELDFPRTDDEQTWGFLFRRYRPHDVRTRISIVPLDRADPCRLCQNAKLTGFQGMDRGRDIEITPTVTAIRVAERDDFPEGTLVEDDPNVEGGVTAKWGLTANLTLAGTLNPDFSQVEADAAQLDVNRQFALRFDERRPFFLEGADIFQTQRRVVHTRSIADPSWGLKLTGKEGRNAIGAFVARDDRTTLLFPGSQGSDIGRLDRESSATVLRYRRDLGDASNFGVLYTDRSAGDYQNRLFGFDARYRLTQADLIEVQILGSQTQYPSEIQQEHGQPSGQIEDWLGYLSYTRELRSWEFEVTYEQVGGDFRADLGFMPQVDFRELEVEAEYQWFGDSDDWYTSLEANVGVGRSETLDGDRLNDEGDLWFQYSGPKQTNFSFGYEHSLLYLEGQELDDSVYWADLGIQPTASVGFGWGGQYGNGIDFRARRQGQKFEHGPFVSLQLGRHLQALLVGTQSELDIGGEQLFKARQTELRLTYQFNARSFLRAIVQHTDVDRNVSLYENDVDESEQDLFGQLLFSYKLTPLTALFLGYTGAYLEIDRSSLIETGNTFFFKVGYAWKP